MSGLWNSAAYLEYTAGDFDGDAAFTIAVLTDPVGHAHGLASWFSGGVEQGVFLQYNWHLFGKADFSDGYGTFGPPAPGWMVYAITKAAGSSLYRCHAWTYASDGSGVMSHGVATGAGAHPDFSLADAIRFGFGAVGGDGRVVVGAMWNQALSDAALDTLKSADLADWLALSPAFGVELSDWNGTTGDTVFAGTSVLVGEVGAVAVGANPAGFNFDLSVDAEQVHVEGDITLLGNLFGGKIADGLKRIVGERFKQLPK